MAVHLLVAVQLLAWAAYMVVAYLAPDNRQPDQSLEGFVFLCVVAITLCFVPALRLAQRFELQPFAFAIACLPIVAVSTVLILKFL